MNRKLACSLGLAVFALCWNAPKASAGNFTMFSDLGPSGNVYNCCTGWTVSGTGTIGTSYTEAGLFTPLTGGNVTQIDLGVSSVAGPDTFYASIWTDSGGTPGTQVAGAYWSPLNANQSFGGCCGLVTISGISGVSLTAGQSYFMILGPLSTSDSSWNPWNWNNQGVNGLDLYSTDGGSMWNGGNGSGNPLGAFDILGTSTPEPSAAVLFATAGVIMVGLALARRNS